MVAAGSALISSFASDPLTPVGDVQGAVGTPAASGSGPTGSRLTGLGAAATTRPTASSRPSPSLTPSPSSTPPPGPMSPEALTGYRSPLPRGRLTLPFGPSRWGSRLVDGADFHDGVDLATFCGDRVTAAHEGTVLAAGRRYDQQMGWVGDLHPYLARLDARHLWSTLPIVVVIDDGNGYRSVYAHFSKVVVKPGDSVTAGQLLGFEGMTGRASGCHVHYGLFSPLETATFEIDPAVVKRMKVPARQIARIDPLLVLPQIAGEPKRSPLPSAAPTASPG